MDDEFLVPGAKATDARARVESKAQIGLIGDYALRNDTFDVAVGFGAVAIGADFRGTQVAARYTRFALRPTAVRETYAVGRQGPTGINTLALPLSRVDLELGRYRTLAGLGALRVRGLWRQETEMSGSRHHEFGAAADASVPLAVCWLVPGGIPEGDPESEDGCNLKGEFRVRTDARFRYAAVSLSQTIKPGPVTVVFNRGVGIDQRPDGEGTLAFQIGASATTRLVPRRLRVRADYRLTGITNPVSIATQVNRLNHEVAVSLVVPLYSRDF